MIEYLHRTGGDLLADQPAIGFTAEALLDRGRRRARRRRVTALAGGLSVLVALVGGFYVGHGAAGAPARPTAAPTAAASVQPTPTGRADKAPARLDPLIRLAVPGWLPAGFTSGDVNITRDYYSADYFDDPTGVRDTNIAFLLTAAGRTLEGFTNGRAPQLAPAGEIDGHPAFWEGPDTAVRWEYAPGGWARVFVRDNTERIGRPEVLRIAAGLRIGGDERLRFPFAVTGLPAGLAPVKSHLIESPDNIWAGTVTLDTATAAADSNGLTIGATGESDEGADPNFHSNTTVDGHRARIGTNQDGSSALRVVFSGWWVLLDASAPLTGQFGADALLSYYHSTTLFGPDRTRWTDQPIR